ncbi:MAG: alpha/beta fold hydrolase [Hydrogenophaga sp.]
MGDSVGHGRRHTPVHSVLARGQRCLLAGWLAALLACLAWVGTGVATPWAWCAVLWLLGAHPLVLGVELLCARLVHGDDPAPRPAWRELARAWWIEWGWSLRVFAWQQPWRWRRLPDGQAPVPGRRAVVLVHGFLGNRGFWLPWLERLSARGVPYVTLNLEPVFGSIDAYVPQIEAAVRRAEALTGERPLLVGHSMGGLAIRAWMAASAGAAARVAHVVTIGSPHGGTWLARWSRTPNGRQMRRQGDWLVALGERERRLRPDGPYAGFTCWYANTDNVVFPASTATLPGADNRLLRGRPHIGLAFAPAVWADVMAWLSAPGRGG